MHLQNSRCLVVGAGSVGLRKARALVRAGARTVLIVDPKPCALPEHSGLTHIKREFAETDLTDCSLVFAATSNRTLNARIAHLCREQNIPCNVADAPELGTFTVPAHFSSRELDVAVGTKGTSPTMAARICRELAGPAADKYSPMLRLLAQVRPMVLELDLAPSEKKRILGEVVASGLTELLSANKNNEAHLLLCSLVPESLHSKIGELFHDDQ